MKYSESLRKNWDFQLVYKKGTSYANRYLVMYVLKNQLNRNRIGISVSKKVGNSVVRHHLTRLIRESYRLNEEKFACGYDMIVIVRVSGKEQGFRSLESALLHLGKLHKILRSEENENNIDQND
ncbi:MAG TPA: ribonuclease P protein component [Candidatus Blautia stercorigallinarum]|uniref:Ribonuclease P protein component n=1 Tax=Candidatus Blautia stercorigallinarum TaxID=2838501 RepID=A0A9D1PD58_9FIRM|nr:ribonuclease P protein component [Candidatus Blautia stercorigallinarum]